VAVAVAVAVDGGPWPSLAVLRAMRWQLRAPQSCGELYLPSAGNSGPWPSLAVRSTWPALIAAQSLRCSACAALTIVGRGPVLR